MTGVQSASTATFPCFFVGTFIEEWTGWAWAVTWARISLPSWRGFHRGNFNIPPGAKRGPISLSFRRDFH